MDKQIEVVIKYKLDSVEEWKTTTIPQDEYFYCGDSDSYEVDSVSKYDHAVDYIKDNKEQVTKTILSIVDKATWKRRIIRESMWNKQNNRLIERIDDGAGFEDYELIIVAEIPGIPTKWMIIRAIRDQDCLNPIFQSLIIDEDDGSQSEIKIVVG